jgi:hypothetical protein
MMALSARLRRNHRIDDVLEILRREQCRQRFHERVDARSWLVRRRKLRHSNLALPRAKRIGLDRRQVESS